MDKPQERVARAAADAGYVANVRIMPKVVTYTGITGWAKYRTNSAHVYAMPHVPQNWVAYALCHEIGHLVNKSPVYDDIYLRSQDEAIAWEYGEMWWDMCFEDEIPPYALKSWCLGNYDPDKLVQNRMKGDKLDT